MSAISQGPIAPLHTSNVLMNQQNSGSSSSASNSIKTSSKPFSFEASLNAYRATLLQKIGKVGDAPSKTGLNLQDAEEIDSYVMANMTKWRQMLNDPVNRHNIDGSSGQAVLTQKKSKENGLPRTLVIGFHDLPQMGLDETPCLRIVVLCKRKVSATEHPDANVAKAAKPTDPVKKVSAVGAGAFRIVKAAFDWLSGEMLVEILSKKSTTFSDLTGKPITEVKILGRLAGCQNIVPSGFLLRLIANNSRYSYLMHRYKGTLAMELKSAGPVPLNGALVWMKNLSVGLCEMKGRYILHNDAKKENILVDEDGTLKFADFDVATSLFRYGTNIDKKTITGGTPHYFAPEVWHSMLDRNLIKTLLPVAPFGRDIWATGWLFAEIVVRSCAPSSKSFDDFDTKMQKINKSVYNICKKIEARKDFNFTDDEIDGYVTKFIEELKADVEGNSLLDEKEKETAKKLIEITREMFQVDAAKRLTAEQLKAHLALLN